MRGKRAKEIRRLARSAAHRPQEERRFYQRIKRVVSKVGAKRLSK